MSKHQTRNLTAKERSFVEAYVTCLNGAEAVRKSAYSVKPTNQSSFANKLLGRPHIKAEIQEWQRKRSVATDITAEMLLKELRPIACIDPREILHGDGTPKSLGEMGEAAKAIKRLRVTKSDTRTVTEIEFHDKLSAVDKVARLIGAYDEDRRKEKEVDHLAEFRARLAQAAERAHALPVRSQHAALLPSHSEADLDEDLDPITGEILP